MTAVTFVGKSGSDEYLYLYQFRPRVLTLVSETQFPSVASRGLSNSCCKVHVRGRVTPVRGSEQVRR